MIAVINVEDEMDGFKITTKLPNGDVQVDHIKFNQKIPGFYEITLDSNEINLTPGQHKIKLNFEG